MRAHDLRLLGPAAATWAAAWLATGATDAAVPAWSAPLAGRIAAHRALRTAPGPRDGTVSQTLAEALSALAARHRRPGLRVIVSDLIDPAGEIERPFDWEAPGNWALALNGVARSTSLVTRISPCQGD